MGSVVAIRDRVWGWSGGGTGRDRRPYWDTSHPLGRWVALDLPKQAHWPFLGLGLGPRCGSWGGSYQVLPEPLPRPS